MSNIKEILHKYDKEFVKGALRYTLITRASRNYVVFANKVDGVSRTVEKPLNVSGLPDEPEKIPGAAGL